MTEPLQVGQFAIVDHEPVDRGPNAGVFTGKGPADDRAELYVVAEGTTPAGEAFAGHVISAAGQAWAGFDMSLTGAIRRVFIEAARSLGDWNAKSIAQHRVSLGVSAVARRGAQTVIAQAGPSVAFHKTSRGLIAYYPDEEHAAPIGGPTQAEPQIFRVDLQPGDRLLLVNTGALNALDDTLVEGILKLPGDQVLKNLYRRLQDQPHATVLYLSNPAAPQLARRPSGAEGGVIDATAGHALPAAKAPQDDASYQPSLFIEPQAEDAIEAVRRQLVEIRQRRAEIVARAPVMSVESLAPLRRASGDGTLARLAAERRARAAISQADVHVGFYGPAWRTAQPEPSVIDNTSSRRHRSESFSRGLARDDAPPLPSPNLDGAPLVDDLADDVRTRASTAVIGPVADVIAGANATVVSAGGALIRVRENRSGRWKGNGMLDGGHGPLLKRLPPTWLVIAIGLSLLLVAVGYVAIPRVIRDQSSVEVAQLLDDAQRSLATAKVLQNPAERRAALVEAQTLLLQAREQDASQQVADLLSDATAAIKAMDAVTAPAKVEALADLAQFGEKAVNASRIVVGEEIAYILDANSGKVIATPLNGSEKAIVYSEDKGANIARPQAMLWIDGADLGEPSLLIADTANRFWAYSPGAGLRPIPVATPAGLVVTDIATFGRDLYALDATHKVVYRFSPGAGSYVAPFKALETDDLKASRRLLVDGEIVTADEDGTIRRFSGTTSLILSEAGIDKRLVAAATPFSLGQNGDLAVLDAANDRVVILRRDGVFERQYRHKDFSQMDAFAIQDGVAYVFSGGKLRRVTW
ncbi:MAG: hypothetical protein ACKVVT_05145 [Dehalococcoidia bacterium]